MSDLKEHCFLDNATNDDFVGIRSKDDNLQICFPLGFGLNIDDKGIRADIRKMMSIFMWLNNASAKSQYTNNSNIQIEQTFPLIAYKNIIEYFLAHGYYTERESIYQTATKGKINFARTLKKYRPIVQKNGSFV